MDIEQILADARERAGTLRFEGHPTQAAAIERVCDEVAEQLGEFTTFMTEAEAMLYSGHKAEWLRARFPRWEERGLAKLDGKNRKYRRCVLQHRGNADAEREAGRRAAQGDAA